MKIKQSILIKSVFFLLILNLSYSISLAQTDKPNVIVIYADDLGYGDLSSYGATQVQTPHIDQLASNGIKFTNAHSMASTCTPSRYSLLTGVYAFRNRDAQILPGNASMLINEQQITLPKIFKSAGYKTAVIGKWHIGLGPVEGPDWNGEIKPSPNDVGFDYSFIFPATADRVPTVYLENRRVLALEKDDPIEVSYQHQVGNEPTVKSNPELLKLKSSYDHDGTIVNGIGRLGWMKGGKNARWADESLGEDFLSETRKFIQSNKNNPFFLYYALNEIHVPRMPNIRFKGKSKMGYRGDVILEMDYLVGQLTNLLRLNGLEHNTIIIFSSDNGPVMDDGYVDGANPLAHGHQPAGPFRGGKYSMFEGGTTVPFIVSWPGKIKPSTSDALINHTDLSTSFASLLGVKLGEDEIPDSKNVMNTLLGKSATGRNYNIEQDNEGVLAFVKDGWKYIEPHEGRKIIPVINIETGYDSEPQLYNLKNDPKETVNLAAKYPDKIKEMKLELEKIKETKYQ